jgi:stearoyl-CoA desaturase (delta-9 desaturase)
MPHPAGLSADCPRIDATDETDATAGSVRWKPVKSLWIGTMILIFVAFGPATLSFGAVALFLGFSALTLCFGHSVGMHRRLIHESFTCPLWLEYLCVYLGALVGMAGPIGMIKTHDFRDWAQRQSACHDYFCHRRGFWQDAWWQLHCELVLDHPPAFRLEPRVASDRFYRTLEATWMAQQLPWAIAFYEIGGWGWVVWGICGRVAVSVVGHWLVGHFAHRQGGQSWIVEGAAAQGYNVAIAGLISMGESWHNNHHAFPGSARLGLYPGQVDPGWWLIRCFALVGLAHAIKTPADLKRRPALRRLDVVDDGCPVARRIELAWR